MRLALALRHLTVKKRRALLLLAGYGLGAATMLVMLSVGEAMLIQSRDVALVGGGEVTVLPEGIDLEGLRTGSLAGMYYGIDRARFLTREVLGGPRHRERVASVSPVIEHKLVYLTRGDRTVAVRAGGEIPSRASHAGAGLQVLSGRWEDSGADSAYVAPTAEQLLHQLDHFHIPTGSDTTWGEWHYFNVVSGPNEWWYISYLVGGAVGQGRWGGQLLVTRHASDGSLRRFTAEVPAGRIVLDTSRADLRLGASSVRQAGGVYQLVGEAPGLRFDLLVEPLPHQDFPPVELSGEARLSGYVVPALRAAASGDLCVEGSCRTITGAPAYHDHNWGVWRGVTWEWGMGHGEATSLLYGGVLDGEASAAPFFLALYDSLGALQVYQFKRVERRGVRVVGGTSEVLAPAAISLVARRGQDSLRLEVRIVDAQASRGSAGTFGRWFLQMRGEYLLEGTAAGRPIKDRGKGFFETYVRKE